MVASFADKSNAEISIRKLRPPRALATYKIMIERHAAELGVPVKLANAVVWQESKYRPDVVGSSGERGLMQILPATARGMGYQGNADGLHDPETNLRFGMKYLAKAYRLAGGDICQTVLRYNGGLGAKSMTERAAKYCTSVKKYLNIPQVILTNMP